MSRRRLKLFMDWDQIRNATPQQHIREQLCVCSMASSSISGLVAQRLRGINLQIRFCTAREVRARGPTYWWTPPTHTSERGWATRCWLFRSLSLRSLSPSGSPGPSSDHSRVSSPLFDSGLHLNGNGNNTVRKTRAHLSTSAFGSGFTRLDSGKKKTKNRKAVGDYRLI